MIGWVFTDRYGGASTGEKASLNLGQTASDSVEHLRTNMQMLKLFIADRGVVALSQVHGTAVYDADEQRDWSGDAWIGDVVPGNASLPVADAAVTTSPNLALMIRVADCVPLLLADPESGVVGVAHAGRAGMLDGVVTSVVDAMRAKGADLISARIGPHICGDCYEVPADMAQEAWRRQPPTRAMTSWGTPSIDIAAAVATQLQDCGVKLLSVGGCTLENKRWFSHRRDGAHTGRQAGIVWLES